MEKSLHHRWLYAPTANVRTTPAAIHLNMREDVPMGSTQNASTFFWKVPTKCFGGQLFSLNNIPKTKIEQLFSTDSSVCLFISIYDKLFSGIMENKWAKKPGWCTTLELLYTQQIGDSFYQPNPLSQHYISFVLNVLNHISLLSMWCQNTGCHHHRWLLFDHRTIVNSHYLMCLCVECISSAEDTLFVWWLWNTKLKVQGLPCEQIVQVQCMCVCSGVSFL